MNLPTRIIAVANHKGGAAKTTTAVNLAACLAERGCEVVLLDLDPQGNASSWLGIDSEDGAYGVLIDGKPLAGAIKPTGVEGLRVLPASQRLALAERVLAGELAAETLLSRRLATGFGTAQYVIIDTPPALGLLTVNALAAAHEVLIPVEAHVLALSGVVQIMSTIALVRERLNPRLAIAGFLVTRFNGRTRHCVEVRDRLIAKYRDRMLDTVIRENVRLAEAPSFGEPITAYAGKSTGAADYRALAAEIVAMEQASARRA
jgi:chromosome partitioning protein